jgi:hypothetical protein
VSVTLALAACLNCGYQYLSGVTFSVFNYPEQTHLTGFFSRKIIFITFNSNYKNNRSQNDLRLKTENGLVPVRYD